ncbi:MAG: AI-2E family transporter [Planctomycetaceae bacterium]|nr:AI-2E family transporter [Planctomycetaceae bacterium]
MPANDRYARQSILTPSVAALLLTCAAVAICYFAREVLLPFALAILLSFLLAPLARRLQRWRLGRVGSVILAVSIAFGALGATGWIVTRQVLDLAGNISSYEDRLVERLKALRPSRKSAITEVAQTVEHIEEKLASAEPAPSSDSATAAGQQPEPQSTAAVEEAPGGDGNIAADLVHAFTARPLPVQIVDTTFMPVRLLRDASPLLSSVGSLAVTIVFVIFMLLQRDDLRDRLIRLAGTSRVYLTTQALDDAARRVSRYLLMQLIINGTYGLAVAVGLYFIGLPNFMLWGLLAMLLRFVPYVGPIIASVTPVALSLAVFEGWTLPLATAALFIVLELVTNNILEPWLYGSSTGVSTLGIITAAVFWTWLWGPVGLVLATPLTVCITVMARHMPQFYFLNILLADEPPLELKVRFYQRLLARDYDDATDLVSDYLNSHDRAELGDGVLLPALHLAESDRDAGHLSEDRENYIYESVTELVSDLDDLDPSADAGDKSKVAAAPRDAGVLCLASEDTADFVAASLLTHMLTRRGFRAVTAYAPPAGDDLVADVPEHEVNAIIISTVAPRRGALRTRRICLNLHRRYPNARLLVGLWHAEQELNRTRERLTKTGADAVVSSVAKAIEQIDTWFPPKPPEPDQPATDDSDKPELALASAS